MKSAIPAFPRNTAIPFFSAMLAIAVGSQAAPVLTTANMQVVGDVSITYGVDTTSFASEGAAGADANWDFSGIKLGTLATQRSALVPSATPYIGLYPGTTNCTRTLQPESQVDIYNYFTIGKNGVDVIGESGATIDSTIYALPDEVMHLPFTYGDSVRDSSDYVQYHHGTKMHFRQARESVGDAYGTLKLPSGTFSNAIRVRITLEQYIDILSGATVLSTLHYHTLQYIWYDAGYQEFLFEYHPLVQLAGKNQARSANYWSDPKPVGETITTKLSASGNKLRAEEISFPGYPAMRVGNGWIFRRPERHTVTNVLGMAQAYPLRLEQR